MDRLMDLVQDPFPFRGGWALGVLLCVLGAGFLLWRWSKRRTVRGPIDLAAVVVLVIGASLVVGSLPLLTDAVVVWAAKGPPARPLGPFPVASVELILPVGRENVRVPVRIWLPGSTVQRDRGASDQSPCGALQDLALQGGRGRLSVIVYFPGNGGGRRDSESTAAFLASRGYVVIGVDDVDRDPLTAGRVKPTVLDLDYATWDVSLKTVALAEDKARREARRGMDELDAVASCLPSSWRARLDLDHVGAWGFSFGGASASESPLVDRRVTAVVNEEGTVYGDPARGVSPTPHLVLLENEPMRPSTLPSADGFARNYLLTEYADRHVWRKLVQRPDHYLYIIHGTIHENFSDLSFQRRFWSQWLISSSIRVRAVREHYLVAFFDRYLQSRSTALLDAQPSPFEEVEVLKNNRNWAARVDQLPLTDAERRLFRLD